MGTIAVVRLPAEDFALAETLRSVPDVEFEVERVVAHEDDRIMPFVWALGPPEAFERLNEAIDADPSVDEVEVLAELDGQWLYRMEWVAKIRLVVRVLVEEDGTVIGARGKDGEWTLRILFPEHEALARTYQFCRERGIEMTIDQIYKLENGPTHGRYGLTEEQYKALVTAIERGYFNVPRSVSTAELADELGISHQALSERLRRAHKALISRALLVDTDLNADLVHAR